jgi:hypothetical protein
MSSIIYGGMIDESTADGDWSGCFSDKIENGRAFDQN